MNEHDDPKIPQELAVSAAMLTTPLTPDQQQLVTRVIKLVHKLVSQLAPWAQGQVRDDLVAEGMFGAMLAAQRYQADYGTRFTTYAVPWISGRVRRARDAEIQQTTLQMAADSAGEWLAEEPDTFEVVWNSGPVNLDKLKTAARRFVAAMLYGATASSADPEDAVIQAERKALVRKALGQLQDDRHRTVLTLRYQERNELSEIMKVLQVSDRTVRRIHDEALDALRDVLRAEGLVDNEG